MQRIITRFFTCILFFVLYCTTDTAAQNNFDDDRFSNLRLHIDKRYFLPGETVFFTAYCLSADTMPDKSCTVVLMDEHKQVVSVKRLLLNLPVTSSYFVLPDTDTAKYYSLQYYINTGTQPFIQSKYIFTAFSGLAAKQPPVAAPLIQFFPEGNNIVKGLPVVLYCRITNIPLTAFPLEMNVVNAQGDTLQTLTTTSAGNARMELAEEDPSTLRVKYSFAGKNYQQLIPVNYAAGSKAILNLYPVTDGFVYRIRTLATDSFSLKIEHEGTVYYYATMFLKQGDDFAKTMKPAQLKPGINIFRMMDSNGSEIATRSCYVAEEVSTAMTTATVKDTAVVVSFPEKLTGSFSVSVQRLSKQLKEKQETIPDLRQVDDINLQTMNISNVWTSPLSTDSICVTLTEDQSRNLFVDEPVNLVISSAGDNIILPKKSNNKGQVFIGNSVFADSAGIVIFPAAKDKVKLAITGTYRSLPLFTDTTGGDPLFMNNVAQYYLDQGNDVTRLSLDIFKGKVLKEVVLKSKAKYLSKTDSVEQVYASGIFTSRVHNIARFDLINDYPNQGLGDVASFLNGRIPRRTYSSFGASSALDGYHIYLNESLIDATIAGTINMSDVAFISVMGNNFLAMASFGSAILIYTRKGGNTNALVQRDGVKRNVLKLKGYASNSNYFNPLFDDKRVDDMFRNTLYWNDNVMLNGQREMNLPLLFKPQGAIKITITGFDEAGNYVFMEKVIQ